MSGTQSKIFSFQFSFSVAENILRMAEHPCKLAQSCGFLKCLLMSASFHSNNFRIRLHYGYMPNLFFFGLANIQVYQDGFPISNSY